MSKEEIALELTKLAYHGAAKDNTLGKEEDAKKVVTDLYNYIFNNVAHEE